MHLQRLRATLSEILHGSGIVLLGIVFIGAALFMLLPKIEQKVASA
jgi:hypothetical protein